MLSTRVHGFLDYMMGLLFILLPLLADFPDGAPSTLLLILGAGTILYSLITDYETSLLNILSMKTHLMIDLMAGILLITSPWLFGFADQLIWPFVILGVIEVGASLLTSKETSYSKATSEGW